MGEDEASTLTLSTVLPIDDVCLLYLMSVGLVIHFLRKIHRVAFK